MVIPCGIFFEVRFLWNLSDIFLNFMLLINMYGVCRLFKHIARDMRKINLVKEVNLRYVS